MLQIEVTGGNYLIPVEKSLLFEYFRLHSNTLLRISFPLQLKRDQALDGSQMFIL